MKFSDDFRFVDLRDLRGELIAAAREALTMKDDEPFFALMAAVEATKALEGARNAGNR